MRVLLINPPQEHILHLEGPPETVEDIGAFAPLGLLYIAASIREQLECDVTVCDAPVEKLNYSNLRELIKKNNPDVIGISAYTASLVDALKTARIAKETNEHIHVSLGGPHVFIFPTETLRFTYVDTIVIGEGERVFVELVNSILKNKPLGEIKGIGYKDKDQKAFINKPFGYIENLNELPFPARDLVDLNKYYNIAGKNRVIATLLSSRGCPGRCTFCCTTYKKPRYLSAPKVAEEMKICMDLGIKELFFLDDTFNLEVSRVNAICQEVKKRKLKIAWGCKARIDFITKEMLRDIAEAGCRRIHFGIESGTEAGLKRLKKDINLEQVRKVFRWVKEYNIESSAAFIIGCPSEKRSDILETIRFAKEINPTFAQFSVLTPYPKTEVYREGLSRGIWKDDFWKNFAENPYPDFTPPLWEEILSRSEIYELVKLAYHDFYLRPGYIISSLLRIKNLSEFKRKVNEGLKILRLK